MPSLCDICNKVYVNNSSLWNHKSRIHMVKSDERNPERNPSVTPNVTLNDTIKSEYNCTYCNAIFHKRQHRWRHEKICKVKDISGSELNELLNTVNVMKKEIERLKSKTGIQSGNNTTNNINQMNTNCGTVNNINITYKLINTLEDNIKQEDAIKLLDGTIKKLVCNLLDLIYSNDTYSGYRTILLKDVDESTLEMFNHDNKKFTRVEVKYALPTLCDNLLECIERIATKNKDIIGTNRDEDINVYSQNTTKDDKTIEKEAMKLKKVLCKNYKNGLKTKEIYEKQMNDNNTE